MTRDQFQQKLASIKESRFQGNCGDSVSEQVTLLVEQVVREAFGKKSPAKSYWVYIKASAMDPDMMMRWGHAIYDKGDSVEWVVGK